MQSRNRSQPCSPILCLICSLIQISDSYFCFSLGTRRQKCYSDSRKNRTDRRNSILTDTCQRNRAFSAPICLLVDEPRALPWAGMTDAVGVVNPPPLFDLFIVLILVVAGGVINEAFAMEMARARIGGLVFACLEL